jgi:hypothetical protein
VFFAIEDTQVSGDSTVFTRQGDSGLSVKFHFCPRCASTLFWYPEFRPGRVAVAVGCFDDQTLAPTQAVYEEDRLAWAQVNLGGP